MNVYMFVADANGLTSIAPVAPHLFSATTLYCQSNFHRLCVWGIIDAEECVADALKTFIDEGRGADALNLIKESKYSLPEAQLTRYQRNLKNIPNPDLDPV